MNLPPARIVTTTLIDTGDGIAYTCPRCGATLRYIDALDVVRFANSVILHALDHGWEDVERGIIEGDGSGANPVGILAAVDKR